MKQPRNRISSDAELAAGAISVAHISVRALTEFNNQRHSSAEPPQTEQPTQLSVALLLEDSALRESVAQHLTTTAPHIHILGAYCSADTAIEALSSQQPHAMLMTLPTESGIDSVRAIKNHLPRTQILLLAATEDADTLFKSLLAGASGYLLPEEVHSPLLPHSLHTIVQGGAALNTYVSQKVMLYFQKRGTIPTPGAAIASLSEREREVLAHLAEQLAYKEIAARLSISVETVRRHCHNIYEKLHVSSRTAAMLKFKER